MNYLYNLNSIELGLKEKPGYLMIPKMYSKPLLEAVAFYLWIIKPIVYLQDTHDL